MGERTTSRVQVVEMWARKTKRLLVRNGSEAEVEKRIEPLFQDCPLCALRAVSCVCLESLRFRNKMKVGKCPLR